MRELTSTPSRASSSQPVICSDGPDNNACSSKSPPSSPPDRFPWEAPKSHTIAPTTEDACKPTATPTPTNVFSILGKRKPLNATTDNARSVKKTTRTPIAKEDSHGLTQMQMSLGQTVQKKCKTCGMEYVASSAEDRKLHDKYHKQNAEGYDIGKDFVAKTAQVRKHHGLFKGVKQGDAIVALDCHDQWHRRRKGQEVLEIVQRELGAVHIEEDVIWNQGKACTRQHSIPTYRAFLYVRDSKAVGFLLTQEIDEAFEVLSPDRKRSASSPPQPSVTASKSQSLSSLAKLKARKQREVEDEEAIAREIREAAQHSLTLSTTRHPAVMGVSRIWTSSTHRGQGIAECLLNTAVNWHNAINKDNLETGASDQRRHPRSIQRKQDVAFSQPTEAGSKLARRWFGRAYGWRVYTE